MTETSENQFLWIVAIVAVVAIVAMVMTATRVPSEDVGPVSFDEPSTVVAENSGGDAYASDLGWDNTRSCGGNCWVQTRTRSFSGGTVTCTRQCTYDANNVETCGTSSCSW